MRLLPKKKDKPYVYKEPKRMSGGLKRILQLGGGVLTTALVGTALFAPWMPFTIDDPENVVIQRFGKHHRELSKQTIGWYNPLWESKTPVNVQGQIPLELGYKTVAPNTEQPYQDNKDISIMLTGDEALVRVWSAIYLQIVNAPEYLYNAYNHDELRMAAAEAVTRQVIGNNSIYKEITTERENLQPIAQSLMQKLLNEFMMGTYVANYTFQDVKPPEEVDDAFIAVQGARETAETMRNAANAIYEQMTQNAEGDSIAKTLNADAYSITKINKGIQEREHFAGFYRSYVKNPEIAVEKLVTETLGELMKHVDILIENENGQLFKVYDVNKMGVKK